MPTNPEQSITGSIATENEARILPQTSSVTSPLIHPTFDGQSLSPNQQGGSLQNAAGMGLDGPLLVVAFGPSISYGDSSEETGCTPIVGSSLDLAAMACRYAVYASTGGHWEVPQNASAVVESFTGQIAGRIVVDHVDSATWNGTSLPSSGSIIEATGVFATSASFGEGTATWQIKGDMDSVRIDGKATLTAESLAPWAIGVAGIGLAAWLTRGAWLSLFARAPALSSRARQLIVDELDRRGGASIGDLATRLCVHKTSIEHHIEVLARSGVVTRYPVANRFHYVTMQQWRDKPESGVVHAALAEHPVRRAILDALATHDELPATALKRRVYEATGEANKSKFHYHAQLLRAQGLVASRARGPNQIWQLAKNRANLSQRSSEKQSQGGITIAT